MKLRNLTYSLLIIVFSVIYIKAQNTNPVVSNVAFSISGTTVTVTYDVSDASSTVTISMYVSSDGGANWDYNYGPASGDIGTGVSTGTGKTITWTYSGSYNTNFKIRIYANDETADGSPCPGTEKVYLEGGPNNDGDDYYNTIQIGSQCWLKENLNVGSRIDGSSDQTDNSTIEKYCYEDNESNCDTYGGLYQWDEAMQYVTTAGARGICPTGWHIPTEAEIQTLKTTVANNGNELKALGQGTAGGGEGTNTSGFSALLAGVIVDYSFSTLTLYTYFWSSTFDDNLDAWYMGLQHEDGFIIWAAYHKTMGMCIRCLKD